MITNNQKFLGYCCSICGKRYFPGEVTYTCPNDGGVLDVILDYDQINTATQPERIFESSDFSLWRYLPLLPVQQPEGKDTPLHRVGWTPVYSPRSLGESIGLENVWVKDESPNPTASFKDRASSLLVVRAKEIGAEIIVTASTGNAGAALAGMAAAVKQKAVIFAPKTAPPAKIAQLLVYGARVVLVDGNYDQAVEIALKASEKYGWYCRNTGYNPFTAEGKKTAAFEIWEQVIIRQGGEWNKPLAIFVSVGDGNIISGIHKGFRDLFALGWIKEMPRIFGVQAEGSAAIANAFDAGIEDIKPVSADTIADSISVNMPGDGLRALRAATQTNGAYIKVSDSEIIQAIAPLGRVGIFAEPAGATAFAGLLKAQKMELVSRNDPVLVINTGSGLKDTRAALAAVSDAKIIQPTLADLEKLVATW